MRRRMAESEYANTCERIKIGIDLPRSLARKPTIRDRNPRKTIRSALAEGDADTRMGPFDRSRYATITPEK